MQTGDSLNQSKPVNVSSLYGFLFTRSWNVVKSIATNGLKVGNVQSTRLGKPENGKQTVKFKFIHNNIPHKVKPIY